MGATTSHFLPHGGNTQTNNWSSSSYCSWKISPHQKSNPFAWSGGTICASSESVPFWINCPRWSNPFNPSPRIDGGWVPSQRTSARGYSSYTRCSRPDRQLSFTRFFFRSAKKYIFLCSRLHEELTFVLTSSWHCHITSKSIMSTSIDIIREYVKTVRQRPG